MPRLIIDNLNLIVGFLNAGVTQGAVAERSNDNRSTVFAFVRAV